MTSSLVCNYWEGEGEHGDAVPGRGPVQHRACGDGGLLAGRFDRGVRDVTTTGAAWSARWARSVTCNSESQRSGW